MDHAGQLRAHLLDLLGGGQAHLNFDQAVAGLPPELRGAKPAGLPHTPWRLLEHLRIAQGDILRFCIDPMHVSPEFPAGYWPAGDALPDPGAWDWTVAAFRADRKAMRDLVANPATDLFAPLLEPGGTCGETWGRVLDQAAAGGMLPGRPLPARE